MRLVEHTDGFDLVLAGTIAFRHRIDDPWLYVGRGEPTVHTHRGLFRIDDQVIARIPLVHAVVYGGRGHRPAGTAAVVSAFRE